MNAGLNASVKSKKRKVSKKSFMLLTGFLACHSPSFMDWFCLEPIQYLMAFWPCQVTFRQKVCSLEYPITVQNGKLHFKLLVKNAEKFAL